MKVCLSCLQAQTGGPYCGGCGRTFGVKLCEAKHACLPSPRIRCCPTCGSTNLTEPTRYLNLAWLPVLLAGLAALEAWRWSIAHLPLLGNLLGCLVLLVLSTLLDTTPCGVLGSLHKLLYWLLTLWLLGWTLALLPGKGGAVGAWLRGVPGTTMKMSGRSAMALLKLLGRGARHLVLPPTQRPSGEASRKK